MNCSFDFVSLKDVAFFASDKISSNYATSKNYISTENMLANKEGITKASSQPLCTFYPSFSEKDILISNIRPYFKKIWFTTYSGARSSDVLCVRAKNNIIPEFLYCVLLQDNFFDYIMSGVKGTKMPRGDKTHILNYKFLIPSLNIQRKISDFIFSINNKIKINNRINKNLPVS